ncbi:hypothetical protein [Vibrio aestuarianus]|uniref:hypothetical protein n=1 Tax=Vibrio aestuarianus TaxID=28171 RepID=UPI001593E59D|nr:hypothetical protein [Vibrio aestuarianus]MDE1236594.1 hypothetical protein [Vibrio aestuarianus]MDE1247473.1 hypothetical protein [Vibrio aestuarianus]NGZ65347.1 hypothetical protein [Vibrio aestuarianus subsp. cardii]CAH8242491.1 hypothetical protein VAE122_50009 [Vibrio aestuarianus]
MKEHSKSDDSEAVANHQQTTALLTLCQLGEEDIKAGRVLSSEQIKSRLQERKLNAQGNKD